mmetsp:Transcript_1329/g.3468  ORF Transcript_1329/g.3468 Transcript_1329/m.3468 type:complete len:247 (-) Transcript_1329:65-805(-)
MLLYGMVHTAWPGCCWKVPSDTDSTTNSATFTPTQMAKSGERLMMPSVTNRSSLLMARSNSWGLPERATSPMGWLAYVRLSSMSPSLSLMCSYSCASAVSTPASLPPPLTTVSQLQLHALGELRRVTDGRLGGLLGEADQPLVLADLRTGDDTLHVDGGRELWIEHRDAQPLCREGHLAAARAEGSGRDERDRQQGRCCKWRQGLLLDGLVSHRRSPRGEQPSTCADEPTKGCRPNSYDYLPALAS